MLIYVDYQNRLLLTDTTGSHIISLDSFYQSNTTPYTFIMMAQNTASVYEVTSSATDYIYMSVGIPAVTGSTVLTQNTFSFNPTSQSYEGSLAISGSTINNFLGTGSEAGVYVELKWGATNRITVYQNRAILYSNLTHP